MAQSTARRYRISSEFEEGSARQAATRAARIVQAEISSPMVAALFEIGSAKLQLETQGLPEAAKKSVMCWKEQEMRTGGLREVRMLSL